MLNFFKEKPIFRKALTSLITPIFPWIYPDPKVDKFISYETFRSWNYYCIDVVSIEVATNEIKLPSLTPYYGLAFFIDWSYAQRLIIIKANKLIRDQYEYYKENKTVSQNDKKIYVTLTDDIVSMMELMTAINYLYNKMYKTRMRAFDLERHYEYAKRTAGVYEDLPSDAELIDEFNNVFVRPKNILDNDGNIIKSSREVREELLEQEKARQERWKE